MKSDDYLAQLKQSADWAGTYLSGVSGTTAEDKTSMATAGEARKFPLDPERYNKIKPVIDRLFAKTASIEDFLAYLRFELTEAMNVLPPEVADNKSDGWHGSACVLRAYASLFQLERALTSGDGSESAGLRRSATELAAKWRNEYPLNSDMDHSYAIHANAVHACAEELDQTALAPAIPRLPTQGSAVESIKSDAFSIQDLRGQGLVTGEEWDCLSPESQRRIGLLVAAQTPSATQGASLPPSRADLGGDRFTKLVERWRRKDASESLNSFGTEMHGFPNYASKLEGMAQQLRLCADELEAELKTNRAVAEGQQSSELVDKTPSASPGELETR